MLGGRNIHIGVDIGSSFIKAVEIETGIGGEVTLKKANVVPASEGIRKAVSGMALRGAKVIAVADCPTSCLRYITVPVMPNRELTEAIKWEAKDKIAFPLEEATIDYEAQEEIEEAGVKKLNIKLIAVPTDLVNTTIKSLRDAGIEPDSLILPALAVEYLSAKLNLKNNETAAVVDIGAEFTGINIIKEGLLKFHRKTTLAGNAITKAMTAGLVTEAGRVALSPEDAEKIKIKYGIPKQTGPELVEGKVSTMQLISLIRPATERLLQEIERSFEYYREESAGEKVDSVILFGGGAQLKGLAEYLQEHLGIPVSVGDPFKGINTVKGAFKAAETASCVLANALGGALSEGKGINLLPGEFKQKTIRTFESAAIKSVAAAVIASLMLTFIGMQLQLKKYNEKIKYGKEILNKMAPDTQIALNYERLRDEISERKTLIDTILSDTPSWDDIFKELSNKAPKDVVFTEMSFDSGKHELLIKGRISGDVQDREASLANLISSLSGGIFDNVSLLSAKMGEEARSSSEFNIKCTF